MYAADNPSNAEALRRAAKAIGNTRAVMRAEVPADSTSCNAETAIERATRALTGARALGDLIQAIDDDPGKGLQLTTTGACNVRLVLFDVSRRAYPQQVTAMLRFARKLQRKEVERCRENLQAATAKLGKEFGGPAK